MEKPVHPNIVEFQVTGDYALFSDPHDAGGRGEMQLPGPDLRGAERSDVIQFTGNQRLIWYIDAVRVMNPIQTEVKGIRPIKYHGGNDLSYYTYLKHCRLSSAGPF